MAQGPRLLCDCLSLFLLLLPQDLQRMAASPDICLCISWEKEGKKKGQTSPLISLAYTVTLPKGFSGCGNLLSLCMERTRGTEDHP